MTKEELSKTFEGFMIEELWADVHNKTITGHLRAAERSAEFVLNLLSSESKLTVEAGGGEGVRLPQAIEKGDTWECYWCEKKFGTKDEREKHFDAMHPPVISEPFYRTPPPLTTKGEQNSAPKEEGVEEQEEFELYATAKAFMVNNPDEEDYIQQNFRQFMGFDGPGDNSIQSSDRWQMNKRIVDKYEAAHPIHSSAPDKGEEKYMVQIDVDENIRVGKSEGEEAKTIENYVFEALGAASMCWIPAPSTQEFDSSAAKVIGDLLMERIKEYARSSGDRGRKEWPRDGVIIDEIAKRAALGNDLNYELHDFYTWLKSRIEGEEREGK